MVILVVIMVVAVAGTVFTSYTNKLTGYVTGGHVNVTIIAIGSLTVNSNVLFGNGTTSASPLASVSSEAADNDNTFNNCSTVNGGIGDAGRDCSGMEIENDGNVNINVTFYAAQTTAQFFDSASMVGASFSFAVLDGNKSKNETEMDYVGWTNQTNMISQINASCHIDSRMNRSIQPQGSYRSNSSMNWTSIDAYVGSSNAYLICANLSFTDKNDTITVEFNLTIPADEPTGLKSNLFTFTAIQVS